MTNRPTWTVSGAAKACGVARSTIQRAVKDGRIEGAENGPNGWQIPTESLLAAGFTLQAMGRSATPSGQERATDERSTPLHPDELQQLRQEVQTLQAALQVAHAREHAAQAVAAEKERVIEAQALALRQLMPPEDRDTEPTASNGGDTKPETSRTATPQTPDDSHETFTARVRRWWRS